MLAAVTTVSEATLKDELATLVRSEILYQKGSPPRSTYMFKHALLEARCTMRWRRRNDSSSTGRSPKRWNRSFPETAEALPELLAHHFTEAGMAEKAVGYWLKAGLRSRARSANVEAIGHLQKGLELLDTLEESPRARRPRAAVPEPAGHGVHRRARLRCAGSRSDLCPRARLASGLETPPAAVRDHVGNMGVAVVRGDLRLCMELADEALALAERVNEPGMLMEALFPAGCDAVFRGDFAAAHASQRAALPIR